MGASIYLTDVFILNLNQLYTVDLLISQTQKKHGLEAKTLLFKMCQWK